MSDHFMPEHRNQEFKKVGRKCQISRDARIFGQENIEIGDNVRIDAGVTILAKKGHLKIGSHVHIACGVTLVCGGGIEIGDFCPISFNSMLISASDDFGGDYLVGPIFTMGLVNVKTSPIVMERLSGVGAGSLLLPGCRLKEGAVLGAMSQMRPDQTIEEFWIAFGSPALPRHPRARGCLELAERFERDFALMTELNPKL